MFRIPVMLFIVLSTFVLVMPSVLLGVVNPNISVIGQVLATRTDDPSLEDANTPTVNLGETELVFDAYLNPYAKGYFVFAVGSEGFETEEAYVTIFKNLPVDRLALKAGKYRVGFGKLNPVHPHAYPFVGTPRVLPAMLPGEEGFNETGAQVSLLLPTPGSWASILSADIMNGSSFHPEETKASAGWAGRLSNSFLLKESIPLEIGFSATQGTNNVTWNAKTNVYGSDAKIKLPVFGQAFLTLQGEYFSNDSDVIIDSTTGNASNLRRSGFYTFANLQLSPQYDMGVIYDQYQSPADQNLTDRAVKVFLGYALLEETTLFRLAYERFFPDGAEPVNTITFQIVFSMGPHKPHQF